MSTEHDCCGSNGDECCGGKNHETEGCGCGCQDQGKEKDGGTSCDCGENGCSQDENKG